MPEVEFAGRKVLISKLLKRDTEFRKLHKSHQDLEWRLGELDRQRYLSTDEELERKRIQKLKLQQKDRMEEILRSVSIRKLSAA